MNLTKNFTLEELIHSDTAIRKGIKNTPNNTVVGNLRLLCDKVLQPIRDKYGKPISVTSGYRCYDLNKAVGGVGNSQHLTGEAADITSSNNKELWKLIVKMVENKEIVVDQLIDEKHLQWIHISYKKDTNRNQIFAIK